MENLKKPFRLLFTSEKCEPCRKVKDFLDENGISYEETKNDLKNINIKRLLDVNFFPTLMIFRNNKIVNKLIGINQIKEFYERK